MIKNFLVYSFGKLVKEKNSTVWNWICTASDEFHCFFCSLQVPQEYVASDAS